MFTKSANFCSAKSRAGRALGVVRAGKFRDQSVKDCRANALPRSRSPDEKYLKKNG